MAFFNEKSFNPAVFLKYRETVKDPVVARLIQAGVYKGEPDLAKVLVDGVGGNYIVRPMTGNLAGTPDNYDGENNVTVDDLSTYEQGIIVIGRMHGFKEDDFNFEISGKNFMSEIIQQTVKYWSKVNQGLLISVLKGVFGSALVSHKVEKSFSSLNGTEIIDAIETCGDLGKSFAIVAMHSHIAYKLQKINVIERLKYTDKDGLLRDTSLFTWDGKLVIEDDGVNVETSYALTADEDIVAGKVYYTRSGSEGAYVYTKVASPVKTDIATYYEKTVAYDCYLMGEGAITYQPLNVKVPAELSRDAFTKGGVDVLINRERLIISPYGVSFTKFSMAKKSPTNAELENSANWELAKNGSNVSLDPKVIPLACLTIAETGI